MGNVRRFNEPIMVPSIVDAEGLPVGGGLSDNLPFTMVPGSAVASVEDWAVKKVVITLTNVAIASISSATDHGSVKIATNPASAAKWVIGCSADLTFDFGGTIAGTETFACGIGSTENVNTSFSGNEEFYLADNGAGFGGSGTTGRTFTANSSAQTAANGMLLPAYITEAASDVWLNLLATGLAAGTGSAVINGTVTIYYMEVA